MYFFKLSNSTDRLLEQVVVRIFSKISGVHSCTISTPLLCFCINVISEEESKTSLSVPNDVDSTQCSNRFGFHFGWLLYREISVLSGVTNSKLVHGVPL